MKPTLLLLSLMVLACSQDPKSAPPTKINSSGVLKYHWSKGWLVNTPSRRVALTCSHSNPSTGTKIGFEDERGVMTYRQVAKVFKVVSKDGSENDVSVLLLTEDAPPWAMAYEYAPKVKNGEEVRVLNQFGQIITGNVKFTPDSAVCDLDNPSGKIIAGDSGLPWFNSKGQIVSHNKAAAEGFYIFGPLYSSPIIFSSFLEKIQEAESAQ